MARQDIFDLPVLFLRYIQIFSPTLLIFSVRLAKTLGPPVLQSFEANGRCKKPQLCKNLPNAALSNVDY